jgi:hypothetical protein
MDLHDQVPVVIFHVLEADIPKNARIVDKDIDSAKVLDGGFNDSLAILDAVVVGDGLTTGLSDLIDDDISGLSLLAWRVRIVHLDTIIPSMTFPRL